MGLGLVSGSHGRSVGIVDNVGPLASLAKKGIGLHGRSVGIVGNVGPLASLAKCQTS